jgi:hypothetical protein
VAGAPPQPAGPEGPGTPAEPVGDESVLGEAAEESGLE